MLRWGHAQGLGRKYWFKAGCLRVLERRGETGADSAAVCSVLCAFSTHLLLPLGHLGLCTLSATQPLESRVGSLISCPIANPEPYEGK